MNLVGTRESFIWRCDRSTCAAAPADELSHLVTTCVLFFSLLSHSRRHVCTTLFASDFIWSSIGLSAQNCLVQSIQADRSPIEVQNFRKLAARMNFNTAVVVACTILLCAGLTQGAPPPLGAVKGAISMAPNAFTADLLSKCTLHWHDATLDHYSWVRCCNMCTCMMVHDERD